MTNDDRSEREPKGRKSPSPTDPAASSLGSTDSLPTLEAVRKFVRAEFDAMPHRKQTGLERAARGLEAIRSIVVSTAIVMAILTGGLLLWNTVWQATIEIEQFGAPEFLARQGFTGELFSHRLADQVTLIARESPTSLEKHAIQSGDDPSLQGVVVPGTGISLAAIVRFVRVAINRRAPMVTGDVIANEKDANAYLIIRVNGRAAKSITLDANDLASEGPFHDAAAHVYRHTQPYILAAYLYGKKAPEGDIVKELDWILQTPPRSDDARSHNLRGLIYEAWRNDWNGALEWYERATIADDRAAYAWTNWGEALAALGRFDDALEKHAKAVIVDRNYSIAWSNYGATLARLKRYKDAVPKYERALEIDPENAMALSNYGATLTRLKRHTDAIPKFERALAIDPENAMAWINYGNALGSIERYEDAILKYERAVAIDPENAMAWINYGNALGSIERYEDAILKYERALAIDPENGNAKKGLDFSKLAVSEYQGGPDRPRSQP